MNSHIQLNAEGNFLRYIPAGIPIEWDENNYCTAFALEADGKAEHFHVIPFYAVGEPTYDKIAQGVREIDPVLVDGQWYQRFEVYALPQAQASDNLAAAQARSWDRIMQERDRRKSLGVKVGQHWYHSDADSRIQQISLRVMGASVLPIQWKTLTTSNQPVFVTMTQALAKSIFTNTAASDAAIFAAAEAHRVAMEASSTPESYDCSGGWPVSIEDAP